MTVILDNFEQVSPATSSVDEYILGASDCRDGIDHMPGASDAYTDGYSMQYEKEQRESAND